MDKKSYKDIDIYYIGCITIKKIGDCENIYSVNPLYLIIGEVDGHIECNCIHCVKSIQIRSYFWFIFSCIWTEHGQIQS